jgi:hypothetical protein
MRRRKKLVMVEPAVVVHNDDGLVIARLGGEACPMIVTYDQAWTDEEIITDLAELTKGLQIFSGLSHERIDDQPPRLPDDEDEDEGEGEGEEDEPNEGEGEEEAPDEDPLGQ